MCAQRSARGVFVDREVMGMLIRDERTRCGFKRVQDLVAYLGALGYPIHENTIYKIERGEGGPEFETFVALAVAMPKILSLDFLQPSLRGAAANAKSYSVDPDGLGSEHNNSIIELPAD